MTKLDDLLKEGKYNYVCRHCGNCFKDDECDVVLICTHCNKPFAQRIS